MCTGRPPFRATTTLAVLKRVVEDDPRPIREINPEVPEWLCRRSCRGCTPRSRPDRFQSAKDVADLLARYLSELQSTGTVAAVSVAAAPTAPAPGRRPMWRRRRVRVVVLLALALGISPVLLYVYNKGFGNVSRSLANRADIRFATLWDPNIERVLVTRDGEPVGTVDAAHSTLRVAPGQYQVQVVPRPGYRLGKVTIDTSGVGPTMTGGVGHRDGRFNLILYRGDEFRVFLTTEAGDDLATVEARNRAAINNNLAEIGRAVNDFPGGWARLFNGRDLTGWQAHPEQPGPWTVQDGVLRGFGAKSLLMGTGEFADFHLRCQVRIGVRGDGTEGSQGGLFFWADDGPTGSGQLRRWFEAQINPSDPDRPRTGSLIDSGLRHYAGQDPLNRPDEWFTYEVIAQGKRVQLKVNGRTTLDWTNPQDQRLRGRLALQLKNPWTVLEFRSIEVRELAPDAPLISETDLSTYQNQIGKSFRVRVTGSTAGHVYGTDVYTADSVLGRAAVHAGVLKEGQTGTLKVTVLPGQAAYKGSARNGVVSRDRAAHPASFRIDGATDLTAAPPRADAPFDAAKAKDLQAAWAKHLGVDVEVTNSVGMKLRLIPPGEFTMGSGDAEREAVRTQVDAWAVPAVAAEGPPHKALVAKAYYLGTNEVTVGQFRQFVAKTGYQTAAEKTGTGGRALVAGDRIEQKPEWTWKHPLWAADDDNPVVQVTLDDARAFCAWLSQADGVTYALPTEEQWEYACRAGTTNWWPTGNDPAGVLTTDWVVGNSQAGIHRVGRRRANPFGLYDLCGNAEELCDWEKDGKQVSRGGHANLEPWLCRPAARWVFSAGEPYYRRGFRVAVIGDLKAAK